MSTGVRKSGRRKGVAINVPVTALPGSGRQIQACEVDQEEGYYPSRGSSGGTYHARASTSYS
jgi:hypothetical protein